MAKPEQQRRAGRPPVSDEEMVQINVRITASQLAKLDEEASKLGRVGRNAVIRRLIDKNL